MSLGHYESGTDSESSNDHDQRVCPDDGIVFGAVDGEQILFPECDSEDKDWIISDSENSNSEIHENYDAEQANCVAYMQVLTPSPTLSNGIKLLLPHCSALR